MTKLKALLLFFISLFLLVWPPKQTNSCGFYILGEEYRFWSFDPSNNAVSGMQPFFYSMELYHNGFDIENRFYVNEINTNSIDEYEQNMDQWLKNIYKVDPNAKVSKDDIYEVLYEFNPIDYFAILDGLKKENSFVAFASKYPSVLEYLNYAKKSEYQSNYKDGWICESCPELVSPGNFKPGDRYFSNYNVNPDPIKGMELIENGLKYLTKEKDKFLQERFAFQIVRLGYYNLDSLNLNEAYLKYLEPLNDQNWLKGAANMYHVLNLTGPKRNLGLARIFDACPDKRYRCQQLFQNDLFGETVELANNNHERMLLEVIHSISNPNEQLQIIKKIGRFEPNSKYLPALWVREINKLEDWILGPLYSDFGSTKNDHMRYESEIRNAVQSQLTKDKKYALEVAQYLENSNSLVSSSPKSFHHLCLGYLYFILKDLNKAEENYSKVIPNELDEIGKVQFGLNQFMLHLSQTQKVTPQLESDLANCLQLLVQTETQYPQRKMMKFQLINFAAKEFFDRGERAKGLLLFGFSAKPYASHSLLGIGNMYTQIYSLAEPKDIDEMLLVLGKRNPNSLEKFIQTHKVFAYTYDYGDNMEFINKNKLLDLKSMLLVQTDKLLEAHAAVAKIDTAYWSNEVYSLFKNDNPFLINPWNGHAPMNDRKLVYNKATFLNELIELKQKAALAQGEQKAKLNLKIANAYYSMSYIGKYWIMQKNYQGGSEPDEDKSDVNPEYYSAARAKYYYHQVLNNTKDPQLIGMVVYILQVAYSPNSSEIAQNKSYLKKKSGALDIYEQLSGNCALFYEMAERYN